tara:strand:+ start:374 stop:496 length:123 start_codon:yes stop_codon:yes gene_type:complete
MRSAKWVMRRFAALGKAAEAVFLAQDANFFPASGEDCMRV